jgi:hypothetical protein
VFHTQDAGRAAKIFEGHENVQLYPPPLTARPYTIFDAPAFLLSIVLSCHCAAQTARFTPAARNRYPGGQVKRRISGRALFRKAQLGSCNRQTVFHGVRKRKRAGAANRQLPVAST